MLQNRRIAQILLVLGDISILYVSVWITLVVRFWGVPDHRITVALLTSFSALFLMWFGVYLLSGLYDEQLALFKRKLPEIIFTAQAFNVVIAALVFFLVPFFQVTPKTILGIYLIVSTVLMYGWRLYIYPYMFRRYKRESLVLGSGEAIEQLATTINHSKEHPLHIRAVIHPDRTDGEEIEKTIQLLLASHTIQTIIIDVRDPLLKPILEFLYTVTYVTQHVTFIDARDLYQEVFERAPLQLIDDRWIFEHISLATHRLYIYSKRSIDIIMGIVIACVTLILLPFVAFAIFLEDKGSIFIQQKRIGKHTHPITLYKFRSMQYSDSGVWENQRTKNKVTRVGWFLRKTHIDELPQVLNILTGSLSLVGPRPDIEGLYEDIQRKVPLYTLRYAVTPGLTGWAQTSQVYENGQSPQSLVETQTRLAYDLFYIKNRSLLLDFKIIIRTFGTLVTTVWASKE